MYHNNRTEHDVLEGMRLSTENASLIVLMSFFVSWDRWNTSLKNNQHFWNGQVFIGEDVFGCYRAGR